MLRRTLLATLVPTVLTGIIAIMVLYHDGSPSASDFTPMIGGSKHNPTVREEIHRVHAFAGLIELAKRKTPYETQAELAQMIAKAGLRESWVLEVDRLHFADGTTRNSFVIVHLGMLPHRLNMDKTLMEALGKQAEESTGKPDVITIPKSLNP